MDDEKDLMLEIASEKLQDAEDREDWDAVESLSNEIALRQSEKNG